MDKDKKLRRMLFGAVLLEVGGLGAVGLAIAACSLLEGHASVLEAMQLSRVLLPATVLLLIGLAGLSICVREYMQA